MAKRKRGPMAKAVRKLCSSTLLDPVNKSIFNDGLRKIIDEWEPALGNLALQDIGLAIQSWARDYVPNKIDEKWQLVDEVEPRIKQEFEKLAD